ncbi:MAG: hypothetical protein JKY31_06810 [Rhodobacteraceae bacterium]|nr:hypothetical protein [Paracoccaceae bacterium]
MRFGKFRISPWVIVERLYNLLAKIWFIPFGFYARPISVTGTIPHPLAPRTLRDLLLQKMMFPDNIERAIVSDKIAARGWVADRIGADHLIPLYGIYDTPEELYENTHPFPYVIKTNHASGQYFFVNNQADLDKFMTVVPKWNAGEHRPKREWAYRGIRRKFMVEKFIKDPQRPEIVELKLMCFFGTPVMIQCIRDRGLNVKKSMMTPEWKDAKTHLVTLPSYRLPERPAELEEALRIGRELSADFDWIRVDLYVCAGRVYFGEMTNFTHGGDSMYQPHSVDKMMFDLYHKLRNEKIDGARAAYQQAEIEKLSA